MAAQRVTLQSSAVQSATSNGGSHTLNTATMGILYLNVSSVTGTTPLMSAYLQGSSDGGTTWFDIPYDQQLTLDTDQADNTANTNKRNIIGADSINAAGQFAAVYKHLAAQLVRIAWNISGSFTAGQGFTFSAILDVK